MTPQELIKLIGESNILDKDGAVKVIQDLLEANGEVFVIDLEQAETFVPVPEPEYVYPDKDGNGHDVKKISSYDGFKIGDQLYYKNPVNGYKTGKLKWFLTGYAEGGIAYDHGGWDFLDDLSTDPDCQRYRRTDDDEEFDDGVSYNDW